MVIIILLIILIIIVVIIIIIILIIMIIIVAIIRRNYEYIIRRTTIILTIISTRRIVIIMIRQSLLAELGRSFSCSSSSLFSLSKNSSWQDSTVKVSPPPPAPRTKPRPRPQIRSSGWKGNEPSTQHLPTEAHDPKAAVEQSVPEEPPEAFSGSHAPQLYTLPAQNRSPLPHPPPPLPPSPPKKKKRRQGPLAPIVVPPALRAAGPGEGGSPASWTPGAAWAQGGAKRKPGWPPWLQDPYVRDPTWAIF